MKRALWIFTVALVLVIGAIASLYLLRKNKALQQYVHTNSQAVLSISIDEILLNNIGHFLATAPIDSVAPPPTLLNLKNWRKAGVYIPAQIHLFTLPDDPFTFFTIQKITNYKKWNTFLTEHLTDSINSITHAGQQLSRAQLSSGVYALYDQHYLLLCFTTTKQDEYNSLQAIWDDRNSWTYVHHLPLRLSERKSAHIAYLHTDGTFQLFADVADRHIKLAGDWQVATDIPPTVKRRKRVNDHLFLSLWTALPLAEMAFITQSLSTLSGIHPDQLIDNTDGYMDLYISTDQVIQQDTAIVYDYDADFNSIEKKEITEIGVPAIESVWKGNGKLATLLPEKLFYRFNKKTAGSLIQWTTQPETEFSPTFVSTSAPFQVVIDFRHLPTSWTNNLLHWGKEKVIQMTITTSVVNQDNLGISGTIRYGNSATAPRSTFYPMIFGYKHPVLHDRPLQNQTQRIGRRLFR